MENNTPETQNNELILVNILEGAVRQQVKESIKEMGACDCEMCYFNACALALNSLEPKYVTTTKGALLSEISDMQLNQANTLVEVTKAVMQVMEHPYHG